MELYWCRTAQPNVGDALNLWLWPRVLPALADSPLPGTFYGIGSVLDERLNSPGVKYILGSGARSHGHGIATTTELRCLAVRGPLTANALGLPARLAAIDPATLIAHHYQAGNCERRDIGFVPYFASPSETWRPIAENLNLRFISPHLDVEPFLTELSHCSFVITEAMHGAILSDALRIPWFAVGAHSVHHEGATNAFKWTDWCKSVELDFKPMALPPTWPASDPLARARGYFKRKQIEHRLRSIIAGKHRYLSDNGIFQSRLAQLEDVVGEFNRLLTRDAA